MTALILSFFFGGSMDTSTDPLMKTLTGTLELSAISGAGPTSELANVLAETFPESERGERLIYNSS